MAIIFVKKILICFRSRKDFQECLWLQAEGKYNKRAYAWGFQKHSPYLELFNFYLHQFDEKGAWHAIEKRFELKPQVCPDLNGKPLGLSETFTAFGVLAFGIAIGILTMLVEYCKLNWIKNCLNVDYHSQYSGNTQTLKMIRDLEETVAKLSMIIENQRKMINDLEFTSHSKN